MAVTSGEKVVVIGAGIAGLVCALDLAVRGLDVTVIERATGPGGKMREVEVAGVRLDAGPTVFTMRHVFEEIFSDAGTSLDAHVTLRKAETLARHAWADNGPLDLFADRKRSADAISAFAGPDEGRRYLEFCARARRIHDTLDAPFMRAQRPSPLGLVRRMGPRGLGGMMGISPFTTLWSALGGHFRDPRLRQLFGRYATYCGSSPFSAPATLMLVAHVEQEGVWLVDGGMHRIARALAGLAESKGARFRYGADVARILVENGRTTGVALASGEVLAAGRVVVNADSSALARGVFGKPATRAVQRFADKKRSLSALTFALSARTSGFPLLHHNVFFSSQYEAEFRDIFGAARLPDEPTVYVCAQDRADTDSRLPDGPERLFCIVNAPATGDTRPFTPEEIERCTDRSFDLLARCGLKVDRSTDAMTTTTPSDYDRLFPGTGGALYGRASHGWMASFTRPGSRSRIPGLYLAGGSVHPGPGVPMAALSGRLAAESLIQDLVSTRAYSPADMRGGMSTPSARTASKA